MPILNKAEWETYINKFPNAHVLQSAQWGSFKNQFGWQPFYLANSSCGALVLFRKLIFNQTIAYIPKGPLGSAWMTLWQELFALCRKMHAVVLYIEPDCWQEDLASIEKDLNEFSPSDFSIQPRRTIVLSLQGTQEQWLERMKQKTRYNIRLAEKKGILINKSQDLSIFDRLMQETAIRDGFGVHHRHYYQVAYEIFHPRGMCELFLAKYLDQPLAAIMVFKHGHRAWYFYGASNDIERNRMPTYMLQLEAMRWAAEVGCCEYDLWGIPDLEECELESQFSQRSDGLWGVYRFKRGFGGMTKRSAGVYEKILQPALYPAYLTVLKVRKSGLS